MTARGMPPPFAYFGGKTKLSRVIADLMPPHRVYIEPFFGSGAVLFRKQLATHEIVNDLDGDVVTFFRVLRDQPDELERVCALSPSARDEFEAADLDHALTLPDLERARRFWVRISQSFGQTANDSTGWSVTVVTNSSRPLRVIRGVGRFEAAAKRLAQVQIENCDAFDLIAKRAKASDAVVYADPPYLDDTRASRRSRAGAVMDYRVDMADPESHERLAEVLHRSPATVILSGYHSTLYDRLYQDWVFIERDVTCSSSNGHTKQRNKRVEVLWSNRPLHEGRLFPLPGSR